MRLIGRLKNKLFGLRPSSGPPSRPRFEFKPWPAENAAGDELSLLSEKIIEDRPDLALEVLGFASKFGLSLGWHYLLDIAFILARLPLMPPARILDAGGGNGLLQFILAAYGHEVVSADAFIRTPPAAVNKLFSIRKSGSPEAIKTAYSVYHDQSGIKIGEKLPPRQPISPGEIEYHCCDLENLENLATDEFEAVVSVSALEHNPPEKLPGIMAELRRVAKPGAPLLLTISVDSRGGGAVLTSPAIAGFWTRPAWPGSMVFPPAAPTIFRSLKASGKPLKIQNTWPAGWRPFITLPAKTACLGGVGTRPTCRPACACAIKLETA